MSRPRKQTVDYFPHICNTGKTIYILETNYGNDGYAFWFKMLELLATTEGHYYDCNNPRLWQFLLAKTHVNEDVAKDILATLVDLDAIDRELWGHQVIWVQNLVENVADVYKRRQTPLPQKPSYCEQEHKLLFVSVNHNLPITEVPVSKNPQSKVKESKVKESSSSKPAVTATTISGEKELGEMARLYEENIGGVTPVIIEKLREIKWEYPLHWFEEAVREAVKAEHRNLKYIEAILARWKAEGFQSPRAKPAKQKVGDDPDKFIKGQYGHLVQR